MTDHFPRSRRATIFLAAAFGITWPAWWLLAALASADHPVMRWPWLALYVLGGLGPTLAAYIAVWCTREQAPLREFNQRLVRWRVRPRWYLLALLLPVVLGFFAMAVAVALRPTLADLVNVQPWYRAAAFFGMSIIGGGLEELGWRGIAQEEWGQAMGDGRAAWLIGPIWALWHVPLFFMAGVAQYHASFALFLIGVTANALLFGWLYSRTRSIFLCVLMHAASNAVTMMGIAVPSGQGMSLVGPCLSLAVGALLFLSTTRSRAAPQS